MSEAGVDSPTDRKEANIHRSLTVALHFNRNAFVDLKHTHTKNVFKGEANNVSAQSTLGELSLKLSIRPSSNDVNTNL